MNVPLGESGEEHLFIGKAGSGLKRRDGEGPSAVARREPGHLPDELAPDGAAGAGDEDDAVGEVGGDVGLVEADGLAPEEVLEVDLADLRDRDLPADELVDAGDDPVLDVGVPGQLHHAADDGAGLRRHGDEELVDAVRREHVREVPDGAEDAEAHEPLPLLARVVVEEADGDVARRRVAEHLAGDHRPGLAGPDDEDLLGLPVPAVGVVLPLLERDPRGQPDRAHPDHGQHRLDEGDAPGDDEARREEEGEGGPDHRDDADALEEDDEVADADLVPRPPRQPHEVDGGALDGEADEEQGEDLVAVAPGPALEAEPEGQGRREQPHPEVDPELDGYAYRITHAENWGGEGREGAVVVTPPPGHERRGRYRRRTKPCTRGR